MASHHPDPPEKQSARRLGNRRAPKRKLAHRVVAHSRPLRNDDWVAWYPIYPIDRVPAHLRNAVVFLKFARAVAYDPGLRWMGRGCLMLARKLVEDLNEEGEGQ